MNVSPSIASAHAGPGEVTGGATSAGGVKHRENEARALTRHCVPYIQVTTGCERGTLLAVHMFRPEFHTLLVLGIPGGSLVLLGRI